MLILEMPRDLALTERGLRSSDSNSGMTFQIPNGFQRYQPPGPATRPGGRHGKILLDDLSVEPAEIAVNGSISKEVKDVQMLHLSIQ